MEMRQLRYFVAIARHGSFSKAAEVIYVAQSALSYQLAQLETEIGAELLHRLPRGVLLTDAGQAFLPHAISILKQADDAKASVAGVFGQPSGKVTFGLPPSVCSVIALPLLQAATRDLGGVELELTEELTGSLAAQLRNGTVDLAILLDDGELGEFLAYPLLEEQMCLVSRPGIEKESAQTIKFRRASALPLLLPAPRQGVRPLIDALARSKNLPPPNVVGEINSVTILRSTLAAGIAHTIISPMAVKPELDAGLLQAIPISEPRFYRRLAVCASRQVPMTAASRALLGLAMNVSRELVLSGEWMGASLLETGKPTEPS